MENLRFDLARYDVALFRLGDVELTLFGLVQLALLLFLLVFFTRRLTRFIDWRLGLRPQFDAGTRVTIVSVVRYTLLIVGTVVVLQAFGIRLTTFTVLAGAIGVGVGFGLQQIINNFIAGLIIMFERPIKIGDRIELGSLEGNVTQIGMRRTTVVTNDNIAILVPNSRFITDNVVNLRYYAERIRVRVAVNVSQGADPALVTRLLLDVARAHPDVLGDPPPAVRLMALQGGGNMAFELQVWNTTRINARDGLVSDLNYALRETLLAHDVKLA